MELISKMEHAEPTPVSGDHRLVHWEPGTRVVFSRPTRISILLASLFLLLGLGCFFLLFWILATQELTFGTFAILFLFGSVFGGYGLYGFVECLPRTVIFDWHQQEIVWKSLWRKRVTPFLQIAKIALQVNRYRSNGLLFGGPQMYSLSLKIVENRVTHLACSQVFESDPYFELDPGIQHCLPLLQHLASALSLPGRVLHWDGTVLHTISGNSPSSTVEVEE